MGYMDDSGIIAAEGSVKEASQALVELNDISGFDLKVGNSERGALIGSPGIMARVTFAEGKCAARLPLMSLRIDALPREIRLELGQPEIFLARTQKLPGKLNSAQTAVTNGAGRVALGPRTIMRQGEGEG